MTRAVLDASAILALLHDEPGATEVLPWVAGGLVSAVNLAEVVGRLMEAGMPEQPAVRAIDALALEVIPFDTGLAVQAGALRPLTRGSGLSLGGRACLATARARRLPVVTADRSWSGLEIGLSVHLVR